MSRSVISAYESGQRQPSIPAPARLIEAAGFELTLGVRRMRDHLAHRYFDTAHAILQATVAEDLPDLERAVVALNRSLSDQDGTAADSGPA